ncbi:Fumarylacetoacetate (FAA) hydrolase [[Clostridium] ultunense Esp]|nr:Fumarylacetoacetate (FAA) hydrolase [[Clostridium] ultunense Esp]
MKLATVLHRKTGKERWGLWGEEAFYPVPEELGYPTLLSYIEDEDRDLSVLKNLKEGIPFEEVRLKPPYRPERNLYCVGKNYKEHVKEVSNFTGSGEIPEYPLFFTKGPNTVIGHLDEIDPHVGITNAIDYEGELAVILGKGGRNILEEEAVNYIFAYTIFNDVTARDLQKRHQQFFKGKSLDTFAPFGPCLLVNEGNLMSHPFHIETYVNGEKRQDGKTDQLIFSIPRLIHILSQGMTLKAGDILATGTRAE